MKSASSELLPPSWPHLQMFPRSPQQCQPLGTKSNPNSVFSVIYALILQLEWLISRAGWLGCIKGKYRNNEKEVLPRGWEVNSVCLWLHMQTHLGPVPAPSPSGCWNTPCLKIIPISQMRKTRPKMWRGSCMVQICWIENVQTVRALKVPRVEWEILGNSWIIL